MPTLYQYWQQVLTIRRGFPPPEADYQRRAVRNPHIVPQGLPTYHRIAEAAWNGGAYNESPQLQVLQTYPYSGHVYTQPVPIGIERPIRGSRDWPRSFPNARVPYTYSGPGNQPLAYFMQRALR